MMIVNEIKEIMNGNIKIFNMRIEGETIGFDTPYNSNWNFMARDFEQIIDTLQQENARLKEMLIQNGVKQKMLLEDINKYAIGVIDNYLKEKQAIIKNIKINDKIII